MEKIIKVTGTEIILYNDKKDKYLKLSPSVFNFIPQVGDEVEVHLIDDEYIVNKLQSSKIENQSDRININIVNENNNVNKNTNINNNQFTTFEYGRRVNKWIYILLALFLGGAGVHHFYAGKNKKGMLFLLFCWTGIPLFIAFFEALLALFKPTDSQGRILI